MHDSGLVLCGWILACASGDKVTSKGVFCAFEL